MHAIYIYINFIKLQKCINKKLIAFMWISNLLNKYMWYTNKFITQSPPNSLMNNNYNELLIIYHNIYILVIFH